MEKVRIFLLIWEKKIKFGLIFRSFNGSFGKEERMVVFRGVLWSERKKRQKC